ncbi:unnamed protein product, partial [Rotaria magnacalcarata]
HLAGNSEVTITNHNTNLNIFVLLIGPSDEAEKPLLELGFYSPLSEASALLVIAFLVANFLFRSLCNAKKNDSKLNYSQTLEYDDVNDDNNDEEEDISDNEYTNESTNRVDQHLPSLSQIFIVSSLIGKSIFHLSRTGTKKFYIKVRQYQELSQIDKPDDINYGSRMGKSAEILCKFAAIAELINITLDTLKILRGQNQLEHNDTSLIFIRNITYIIENKYPSANMILEIKSPSCRLAGQLLCSHLFKMLFAFYNVNPILCNLETNMNPTTSIQSTINNIQQRIIQMPQLIFLKRDLTGPMGLLRHFPTDLVNSVLTELVNCELIRQGPFITTSRRAIIFIRSYPSDPVLNDSLKRNTIDQILNDINIDLTTYMQLLCNSIIKDKQILTNTAKQILMLPEHKFLCEKLKEKYPER